MDEVTQQNSALVEENAATAKTLEDQQTAMSRQIGFFRVIERASAVEPAKRTA
jgi:methyl-accepting chemotaxis protein